MNIEAAISSSVHSAIKELYGQEVPEKMVQLSKTRSEFEGNLTLVVFPFVKLSHKRPEDTAQEIGEYLKKNDTNIADYNVVKGFLNLTVAPASWIALLNHINEEEHFGYVSPERKAAENGGISKVSQVEYIDRALLFGLIIKHTTRVYGE